MRIEEGVMRNTARQPTTSCILYGTTVSPTTTATKHALVRDDYYYIGLAVQCELQTRNNTR